MQGRHRLNRAWRFHLGEVPNGQYKGLCDSAWQQICLPHDWSVSQPFSQDCSSGTGYLPGGVGWYRRHIHLPKLEEGMHAFIDFGGVYQKSRVWINSNYLGKRAYGYSSFSHEITDFLVEGDNVIAVRAEHMDLADSRWFTGNGIHREVQLRFQKAPYFVQRGLFVQTLASNQDSATLRVAWELSKAAEVRVMLQDAAGQLVAEGRAAKGSTGLELAVPKPSLWSPDSPSLYCLTAATFVDGELRDEEAVSVGIRSFRFDANEGFFLNDVPMKLRGVCVHHDAGALGAAVPKNVWHRRLVKLKQAGCNALRTSHNPPDTQLLDLCDELGLLVIDEAFDEWEGIKNKWWQGHNVYPPKLFGYADDFPQWHEIDLRDMVRRDRNHPSIILWSIGNEVDYPNDPYVHPLFESMTGNNDANKPAAERVYDPNKPNAERLTTVARRLSAIVKEHDQSRPVTAALAFPELSNLTGYAQALDVIGYNYKEHLYEADHAKYPGHILMGSENGTHAEAWLYVKKLPYISAQFLWTGVDFLGECRGWPVRMSAAGILDAAGFEKPKYALRQALWTQAPCAFLASGETDSIHEQHFGWQGDPGKPRVVSCYSNLDSAELFVNGRSLGEQPLGETCQASWTIPFEPGSLQAVCKGQDGSSTEAWLHSPQGEAALKLRPVEKSLPADGQAVWQVELRLLDEAGQLVTDQDALVALSVTGGSLLGIENGHTADLRPYSEPARATHWGRAIAYVRAGTAPGELTLTARREGRETRLSIPLVAPKPEPLFLP